MGIVSYTAEDLLFRPGSGKADGGLVTRVRPADAGWDLLGIEVSRLCAGQVFAHDTGGHESVLVVLGGRCSVTAESKGGTGKSCWPNVGERANVFSGMPWALYMPRRTHFEVQALTDGFELAHGWAKSSMDHPPALVTPDQCRVELRGGGSASRQINHIIPPGFACHRMVACEVFTPGGNHSSYPPHKHDTRTLDEDGRLVEAALEEVYYYKIRGDGGYALQRVYTDDGSIDAAVVARSDDVVLVPAGYHPVVAAHGYDCYYLNLLAGSDQSLACSDDPALAWTKGTWGELDPRLPMVK